MQTITTQIIRTCRQQFDSLQDMTCASLSGLERAQQSSIAMFRQAMGQQLDTVGRIAEQATQTAFDPEQARPAVEGLMSAQRDLLDTFAETQRRCLGAMAGVTAQDGRSVADSYAEAVSASMDQWQQWMQQFFQVAREQAAQMSGQAQEQGDLMQQAVGGAARSAAQGAEAMRRGAENAQQATQPAQGGQSPRRAEGQRARIIESA